MQYTIICFLSNFSSVIRLTVGSSDDEPANPFIDVQAGCFINTASFDRATPDSCTAAGPMDVSRRSATFSVGNMTPNGSEESYTFKDVSPTHIVWSGACVGTGYNCVLNDYLILQEHVATVTVTLGNETRQFTVTATDERLNFNN